MHYFIDEHRGTGPQSSIRFLVLVLQARKWNLRINKSYSTRHAFTYIIKFAIKVITLALVASAFAGHLTSAVGIDQFVQLLAGFVTDLNLIAVSGAVLPGCKHVGVFPKGVNLI